MKSQTQLIAYVDRLPGGTCRDLQQLLDGPLRGAFGGVHVLPFFHPIDGAGAGFDGVGADRRRGRFDGLLADEEIDALVETIHRRSRGESRHASGSAANNVDSSQINCAFYDALGNRTPGT